jgi:pSer/pThr/pTyr-binding forkhead associated (FHA) protein
MNPNLNRRDLITKGFAGLAGGAIGWLPVEVVTHGHSLTEEVTTANLILTYFAMSILFGAIGGLIVAADSQQLEWNPQTKARLIRGAVICFAIAWPANYVANLLFSMMLTAGGWGVGHSGSTFFLVLGRVASWVAMGGLMGAGVGIATLTPSNVVKGAIGGLVGGLAGGLLFDFINAATGGGLPSRFIGLSAIGLAIGLLIGLVQELTKAAWITVEQGRLRGRQYRVEGARATLGRAEENPIGLFGDMEVQQRHAVIERRGADYVLKSLAVQSGTFVNGNRIESVDLHDGDRINIGGYEMTFHLRGSSAPARAQISLARDAINPAHVASRLAGVNAQVFGPCLIDASGQKFALKAGGVTQIGRALDNDIVVPHSSVSRHHAGIESSKGTFAIKDLNSQNGSWVGGKRVTSANIADGDSIRVGDAAFTFRA